MKATLEFIIPDDESELRAAVHAIDHLAATRDFHERLLSLNKYGHWFQTTEEAIQSLYSDYCDMMQAYL